jgi:hypothetical protein
VIAHLVLFEPRSGLPEAERDRLIADLHHAAESIPSIRRFRIGRRILHGHPGYEQAMTESFSYAAIIEFDDREGLLAYLDHPAHQALGRHFVSATRALAYDYDVRDATAASVQEVIGGW